MAQLPSAFRTDDHGEMNDFSAVPSGDYIAKVVKSEMKDASAKAKDPNGKYLSLHFEIMSPAKFKGKKLFSNLNLINKNPQAVEIANNELATICRAVGKATIADSAELHGIPLKLKVAQVNDNRGADFPLKNDIKMYSPADSGGVSESPKNDGGPADSKSDDDFPFAD